MASYKDTIPQFNPYIQDRPVEAMREVGMYKQQRYDQGVQRIQESIDNIAGLDVVRPQDKQYLQSKLNQLGGQLSSVAGGDFSNFQLINSVNGMTNQIAKDPLVLNAVGNASKYRKDLETITKLQQEGKWADSNQFEFSKDVNAWFNGGMDASYNANISPYVDTTKEATDIVKALAKDYTENDVYYNPQTGEVLDVMTRQKIEGITKEKIAAALKTGLSPQAWRQLAIDGKYKYSNVSPEQYVNQINSSYEKTFSMFSDRRKELINAANIAKTQEEKDRLMLQVDDIDRSIEAIKSDYNNISRGFESGDVENSQAQYYTTTWLENMSNVMSSRGTSNKLMESPYFSTDMKKKNHNLAVQQYNETVKNNEFNRDLAMSKFLADQMANNPFGKPLPMPEPGTDPNKVVQTAIQNVKIKEDVKNKELQKLAETFGWSTEPFQVTDDNGNLLFNYDGTPLMTNEAEKEIEKLIEQGPASTNTQAYDMAKVYYNAQQSYIQELSRLNFATDEAIKQIPFELNEIIPDKYKDKTWLGYNVYETIELMQKFYGISKKYSNLSDPAAIRAAEKLLPEEEFRMYKYVYKGNTAPLGGNPEARSAMLLMNSINSKIKDVSEERNKLTSDLIQKSTPTWQRTRVPILLDKPLVKARVNDYIGAVVAAEGGWPGLNPSDIEKLAAMKGKIDAASFITKDKFLNVQSGSESINIPYTDEQWSIVTQNYNNQVNKDPYVQKFEGEVLPQLLVTNPSLREKAFWTTALPSDEAGKSSFKTDLSNAYFKSFSFPSVNSYNVSGNFVTTVNPSEDFNNGYFYLNVSGFKLRDNKTGKIIDSKKLEGVLYPQAMTKAQAADFMNTVTNKQIEALITRQFPNYTLIK